MTGKATRRAYTEPFREAAVREVIDAGRSVSDVARSLEMPQKTLANWLRQARRCETAAGNPALYPALYPVGEAGPQVREPGQHLTSATAGGTPCERHDARGEADVEPSTTIAPDQAPPLSEEARPPMSSPAPRDPPRAVTSVTAYRTPKARAGRGWSSGHWLAVLGLAYAGIAVGIFAVTELWFQAFENTSFTRLALESVGLPRRGWPVAGPLSEAPISPVAPGANSKSPNAALQLPQPEAAGSALTSPAAFKADKVDERQRGEPPARALATREPQKQKAKRPERAAPQRPRTASAAAKVSPSAAARRAARMDWLGALRQEMDACGQHGFLRRVVCTERARWRHCAPDRWGTAGECPKISHESVADSGSGTDMPRAAAHQLSPRSRLKAAENTRS